jgi:hypothetical protein
VARASLNNNNNKNNSATNTTREFESRDSTNTRTNTRTRELDSRSGASPTRYRSLEEEKLSEGAERALLALAALKNELKNAAVRGNDIVHVQPHIVLSQEGLDPSTSSRIISPRAASSPTDPFYSRQQILARAKHRDGERGRERERETQSGSLQFLRESKGQGGHGREGGGEMARRGVNLSPVAALQLSQKSESFQVLLPKRTP